MRGLPIRILKRRWCLKYVLFIIVAGTLAGCGGGRPHVPVPSGINFYDVGAHNVLQLHFNEDSEGVHKEFRIFIPQTSGSYPLLVFQHGFISDIADVTRFLTYLAEHGFIVVAPQMYRVDNPNDAPSVETEWRDGEVFIGWLKANVNALLARELVPPLAVSARTADTGLFGHSRGGQIAWRLLFNVEGPKLGRAIAGVDPVDGDAPPFPPGEQGNMVTDEEGAFNFNFPSLVIGMGMGSEGAPGFECAPENRNYTFFYDASRAPKFEVVAVNYGHSDMLNNDEAEVVCLGATDGSKDLLRRFIAGQLAAYFTMVLKGFDETEFLTDLRNAPIDETTNRFELR